MYYLSLDFFTSTLGPIVGPITYLISGFILGSLLGLTYAFLIKNKTLFQAFKLKKEKKIKEKKVKKEKEEFRFKEDE